MEIEAIENIIQNQRITDYEQAREAYRGVANAYGVMLQDARQTYLNVITEARVRVSVDGSEKAIKWASEQLASHDIAYSTYERNGKTVRVPVDTGIRREMLNSSNTELRHSQVKTIAEATTGVVEVSTTANARDSHAGWEGKKYRVIDTPELMARYDDFETACMVGDPVDGFGGYNCGHEVAVCLPDEGTRFPDPFEGTDLDRESATAVISRQRELERDLRRLKTTADVLAEFDIDSKVTTAIARRQSQLRELVATYPSITTRLYNRERNYASAKRIAPALARMTEREVLEETALEIDRLAESLPKAKYRRKLIDVIEGDL